MKIHGVFVHFSIDPRALILLMIRGELWTNVSSPTCFSSQTVLIYTPRLELSRGTRFVCFDQIHFMMPYEWNWLSWQNWVCRTRTVFGSLKIWQSRQWCKSHVEEKNFQFSMQRISPYNILHRNTRSQVKIRISKTYIGFTPSMFHGLRDILQLITASPIDVIWCLRPNYLLHPGEQLTISPFLWGHELQQWQKYTT